MELKPGYKMTEVGVIPEDWKDAPLGGLAEIRMCKRIFSEQTNSSGDIPFFKIGTFGRAPDAFISGDLYREYKRKYSFPKKGDVLLSAAGTLGRTVVYDGGDAYFQDSNIVWLDIDHEKITNEYLYQCYQTIRWASPEGSTISRLYNGIIRKTKIPLPPTETEQTAIATALSDVDELLATLDQVIAKKRDLKQAAMQQLLTGKIRLPGFGGEWEAKKLEHAGCCLRGVSYRGDDDLSPHDTAFTKRLLRSNNVQNAFVVTDDVQFVNNKRVSQDQVLQKNDILICMANGSKALVGKAGLFSIDDGFDYTFGAFMGCFRTDASIADPVFVFSLFQTGRYRDYINNLLAGSSINNLSPSSIDSLEFSFPPYAEQVAIGRALAEMDAELSVLEYRRDKTRNIKQAMMQELLTGKTRLVEGGYDG